jgi:mutator protein MutT
MNLPSLNFPQFSFHLREESGKLTIQDPVRRKFVSLTPEEWVRQNCIHYLRDIKHLPLSLIAVERAFNVNGQSLRYDLVAYSKQAKPILLVECKAPDVEITQKTFDQIAVYNLELQVPYLMVTNGLVHLYCMVDFIQKRFVFLRELPSFREMIANKPSNSLAQKPLDVTCAIIVHDGKVLVCQRHKDSEHSLQWEFPGGKVEPGETTEACIVREIKEELGVDIEILEHLVPVDFCYPSKQIRLIPFLCRISKGDPVAHEHYAFAWIDQYGLKQLDWAGADKELLTKNSLHKYITS